MEIRTQAPQPTIICYHSVFADTAIKKDYYAFSSLSTYTSGRNLQSYNFEKSIDSFGGTFSFNVRESNVTTELFMDLVEPLDIITISEGDNSKVDFIGVVTKISIGCMASNLNKVVTVSGHSLEWLFEYYNINADIKAVIFNNSYANDIFKTDLAKRDGKEGISIKDIVIASLEMFDRVINPEKRDTTSTDLVATKEVSNFVVGEIIKKWYGNDPKKYIDATNDKFFYPVSSNLFTSGKINVIDYLKKLLPQPVYEIFGYIDKYSNPKLKIREVPFSKPEIIAKIDAVTLTDFTLTKSCEDVYTAFMPYIEGSAGSPDFYMNIAAATRAEEKGYDTAWKNDKKAKLYGYQLLTCSFVGYNSDIIEENITKSNIKELGEKLKKWFSNLDEMYSGDFTIVNITSEKKAGIGDWIGFAKGMFYVTNESHSWTYGDNPMINYQVIRGGEYINGEFKPLKKVSAAYKEFE